VLVNLDATFRCFAAASPQADATRSTESLQAAEAATADLQLRLVDMAAAAVAAREADIQAALDAARNSAAAAAEREAAAVSAAELRELKAAHMEQQQLHARYCSHIPWLGPCISPQYDLNCLRILSNGWPCGHWPQRLLGYPPWRTHFECTCYMTQGPDHDAPGGAQRAHPASRAEYKLPNNIWAASAVHFLCTERLRPRSCAAIC